MPLVGAILGQGVWILVDTGTTHSVINSSTACTISLTKHRITSTVLFGVPLCIEGEMF